MNLSNWMGKARQPDPYPKNYMRPRKTGSGRSGHPKRRVYQMIVWCQKVSSETYIEVTLYTRNRLDLGMHVYIHICMK